MLRLEVLLWVLARLPIKCALWIQLCPFLESRNHAHITSIFVRFITRLAACWVCVKLTFSICIIIIFTSTFLSSNLYYWSWWAHLQLTILVWTGIFQWPLSTNGSLFVTKWNFTQSIVCIQMMLTRLSLVCASLWFLELTSNPVNHNRALH